MSRPLRAPQEVSVAEVATRSAPPMKIPPRDELAESVAGVLLATAAGDCHPTVDEIIVLEFMCVVSGLHAEARQLAALGEQLLEQQLRRTT
jgi:hypothetical protein